MELVDELAYIHDVEVFISTISLTEIEPSDNKAVKHYLVNFYPIDYMIDKFYILTLTVHLSCDLMNKVNRQPWLFLTGYKHDIKKQFRVGIDEFDRCV